MVNDYHYTDVEIIFHTSFLEARTKGKDYNFIAYVLNELSDEYGYENIADLNTFANDATRFLCTHLLRPDLRTKPTTALEIKYLQAAEAWYKVQLNKLTLNKSIRESESHEELIKKYSILLKVIVNQISNRFTSIPTVQKTNTNDSSTTTSSNHTQNSTKNIEARTNKRQKSNKS